MRGKEVKNLTVEDCMSMVNQQNQTAKARAEAPECETEKIKKEAEVVACEEPCQEAAGLPKLGQQPSPGPPVQKASQLAVVSTKEEKKDINTRPGNCEPLSAPKAEPTPIDKCVPGKPCDKLESPLGYPPAFKQKLHRTSTKDIATKSPAFKQLGKLKSTNHKTATYKASAAARRRNRHQRRLKDLLSRRQGQREKGVRHQD